MPFIKPTPTRLSADKAKALAASLNKDEQTEAQPWKYSVVAKDSTYYVEIHDEDDVRLGYL